ncbi:MAG: hypothetical protein E7394_05875 [Ruminococcaceae bacterium]|nr:hypothetical protein [Oscillospiraceae bacterium]
MIFSFLGLSKPASKVSDALMKIVKEYRMKMSGANSPLNPGGVYVPNLEICTGFASSSNMAVYMNVNDLIRKSDIIFVFLPDATLKSLQKTFRRYDIKGKIFCHFSPEYDAETLDFGSDNTYVSILVPAIKKNGALDFSYGIITQGYGERYNEFLGAIETLGIKVKCLNSDEKCLYQGAVSIMKNVPKLAVESSRKLAKSVLGSDCDIVKLFDDVKNSGEYILSSNSPCEKGDTDYIDLQKKLMKSMGLEDSQVFYAALLLAKGLDAASDSSQTIKDIAKSIIRKL